MDFVADQGAEAAIDQLVPRQQPPALELLGNDQCLEMVIVIARDADLRITEARGNQFFYLGRFHLSIAIS